MSPKLIRQSTLSWKVVSVDTGSALGFIQRDLTPPVPASGVAWTNTNTWPVYVTISGGTVSAVAVNGISTGRTSGGFSIPQGASITVTYSVLPTWQFASSGNYYALSRTGKPMGSPSSSQSFLLRYFT